MRFVFTASLIWCVAGFGVLVSRGFLRDIDPPTSFLVVLSIGVLGGLARLLVGRRHQHQLVFWCRRFGDTDELAGQLNRWHGRIIDQGSKGLALPVTLQDESVATPPAVAAVVVLPVFVMMMIGSLGSALWLFELPWFETVIGKIVAFVTVVLAMTAPSLVAVLVARWLGARKVKPGGVERAARRAMGGNRSRAGMLVLQCRSEHWQACVAELLDSVGYVIIDVSTESSSIEWEIETATQRLGSHRVLLFGALEGLSESIERFQTADSVSLRYDLGQARDELAAFSRSWQQDKHQLADPDAALGPVGTALSSAIRDWMEEVEPAT